AAHPAAAAVQPRRLPGADPLQRRARGVAGRDPERRARGDPGGQPPAAAAWPRRPDELRGRRGAGGRPARGPPAGGAPAGRRAVPARLRAPVAGRGGLPRALGRRGHRLRRRPRRRRRGAQIELVYVTEKYRDFTPGQFVLHRSGVLAARGYRAVASAPDTVDPYYGQIGFERRGDRYVLELGTA